MNFVGFAASFYTAVASKDVFFEYSEVAEFGLLPWSQVSCFDHIYTIMLSHLSTKVSVHSVWVQSKCWLICPWPTQGNILTGWHNWEGPCVQAHDFFLLDTACV